MTKINNQQQTKTTADADKPLLESNLRPEVNFANKTKQSPSGTLSSKGREQATEKKQYHPTPAWFFTLGSKPDAWGPCPGHMFKEAEK